MSNSGISLCFKLFGVKETLTRNSTERGNRHGENFDVFSWLFLHTRSARKKNDLTIILLLITEIDDGWEIKLLRSPFSQCRGRTAEREYMDNKKKGEMDVLTITKSCTCISEHSRIELLDDKSWLVQIFEQQSKGDSYKMKQYFRWPMTGLQVVVLHEHIPWQRLQVNKKGNLLLVNPRINENFFLIFFQILWLQKHFFQTSELSRNHQSRGIFINWKKKKKQIVVEENWKIRKKPRLRSYVFWPWPWVAWQTLNMIIIQTPYRILSEIITRANQLRMTPPRFSRAIEEKRFS